MWNNYKYSTRSLRILISRKHGVPNQAVSTTTQFRLSKPVPSKIFAHGGPGVGKGFMTNVLIHKLKRRGENLEPYRLLVLRHRYLSKDKPYTVLLD